MLGDFNLNMRHKVSNVMEEIDAMTIICRRINLSQCPYNVVVAVLSVFILVCDDIDRFSGDINGCSMVDY